MNTFSTGIIAHRGASGHAPENTLAAIKLAIDMEVEFVEIDVQMTKDGQVVALHDSTINRTTNGSGAITELNLSQVQKLDAGSWFDKKFSTEKIPTLEKILSLDFKNSKLIIEVKNSKNKFKGIEKKIHTLVQIAQAELIVVYKSFTKDVLSRFELFAPNVERLYVIIGPLLGFLVIDDGLRFGNPFDFKSIQYLQVHKFFLTESLIKKAKDRGIQTIVWDVHDKKVMQKFRDLGVDFIETDFPVLYPK